MIDVSLLLSNVVDELVIDEIINFSKEEYSSTDIIELSEIKINGVITKLNTGEINLKIEASGEMMLPCSITLDPVKYPFNIKIDEIIDEKDENNLRKDENTLELKEFLWQNIVVEIPLRVVSDHAYDKEYKGNGWKLITEEDKKENGNKSLEVLKQLLEKEEEE